MCSGSPGRLSVTLTWWFDFINGLCGALLARVDLWPQFGLQMSHFVPQNSVLRHHVDVQLSEHSAYLTNSLSGHHVQDGRQLSLNGKRSTESARHSAVRLHPDTGPKIYCTSALKHEPNQRRKYLTKMFMFNKIFFSKMSMVLDSLVHISVTFKLWNKMISRWINEWKSAEY